MKDRSLFLTLALGVVVGLAFTAPCQATTTLVTTNMSFTVSPGTGTATDVEVTYTPDVTGTTSNVTVVSAGGLSGVTASISGDTLTVDFTAANKTTSDLVISFDTTLSPPLNFASFNITGVSGGATATGTIGVSSGPATVPEPTTISMLGVGMAGFFAYRKWFRKKAVA
jgi:hypothetical protein